MADIIEMQSRANSVSMFFQVFLSCSIQRQLFPTGHFTSSRHLFNGLSVLLFVCLGLYWITLGIHLTWCCLTTCSTHRHLSCEIRLLCLPALQLISLHLSLYPRLAPSIVVSIAPFIVLKWLALFLVRVIVSRSCLQFLGVATDENNAIAESQMVQEDSIDLYSFIFPVESFISGGINEYRKESWLFI